jgi:hypothetical protein
MNILDIGTQNPLIEAPNSSPDFIIPSTEIDGIGAVKETLEDCLNDIKEGFDNLFNNSNTISNNLTGLFLGLTKIFSSPIKVEVVNDFKNQITEKVYDAEIINDKEVTKSTSGHNYSELMWKELITLNKNIYAAFLSEDLKEDKKTDDTSSFFKNLSDNLKGAFNFDVATNAIASKGGLLGLGIDKIFNFVGGLIMSAFVKFKALIMGASFSSVAVGTLIAAGIYNLISSAITGFLGKGDTNESGIIGALSQMLFGGGLFSKISKYAAIGAGVALVGGPVGWITGGLIGAAIGGLVHIIEKFTGELSLTRIWNGLKNLFMLGFNKMKEWYENFNLQEFISNWISGSIDLVLDVFVWWLDGWKKGIEIIKSGWQGLLNFSGWITDTLFDLITTIDTIVSGFIKSIVSSIINFLKNPTEAIGKLNEKLLPISEVIISGFFTIVNTAVNVIKSIWNGIIDGIMNSKLGSYLKVVGLSLDNYKMNKDTDLFVSKNEGVNLSPSSQNINNEGVDKQTNNAEPTVGILNQTNVNTNNQIRQETKVVVSTSLDKLNLQNFLIQN